MGKKMVPTRKTSRGFRGRSHSKQVKPLVVLAVEGATEKQYLNALNQHLYSRAFSFIFCRNVSKSSLKNLVEKIKGKVKELERESISIAGAWIICDVDENELHRAILKKWLAEESDLQHGVVLSNPCIEAWFVYHCANVCSSRTASAVVEELISKWKQGAYEKGREIPQWLIDQTDDACSRVKHRRTSFAKGVTAWDEAPWTDMPELIAWLDQLSPRHSE